MWNNLSNSPCHLSNGRCKYNRLHQCKQCKKQGCKAVLHTPASQLSPSNPSDGTVKNSAYSPSKQTPVQAHPAQQQQAQQQHEQQPEKHHEQQEQSGEVKLPMFGMPTTLPSEYVAVPSQLKQRHIMWCKVQSSNLTLDMPLDSCCSVSLCSLDHAKRIQEQCPHLSTVRLEQPIPASVADNDSVLNGIALQDVPIQWGPGKASLHTMLVVPNLSWNILLVTTTLKATHAVTDHKARTVTFNHPQMQFVMNCPAKPPHRPNGTVESNLVSLSATTVAPQSLVPGLNFVRLCLVVITCGYVASTVSVISDFLTTQPMSQYWVSQNPAFSSSDLEVIPGLFCAESITSYTESNPNCTSTHDDEINIEPCTKHYVTVAVNNLSKNEIDLPLAVVAQLQPVTTKETELFHEAAINTADVLSEEWLDALQYRNLNILAQQPSPVNLQLRPFFPEDATQEMQMAFGPH